jgi:hypothetical protein
MRGLDDLTQPRRGIGTQYKYGAEHHRARHDTQTVERARTLRERHGWPYRRIGEELGVSRFTVADWCKYATRFTS